LVIGHKRQPAPEELEPDCERGHQVRVGGDEQVLLVLLAGAAGPVEAAGYQPPAVEQGELVVHVGRIPQVHLARYPTKLHVVEVGTEVVGLLVVRKDPHGHPTGVGPNDRVRDWVVGDGENTDVARMPCDVELPDHFVYAGLAGAKKSERLLAVGRRCCGPREDAHDFFQPLDNPNGIPAYGSPGQSKRGGAGVRPFGLPDMTASPVGKRLTVGGRGLAPSQGLPEQVIKFGIVHGGPEKRSLERRIPLKTSFVARKSPSETDKSRVCRKRRRVGMKAFGLSTCFDSLHFRWTFHCRNCGFIAGVSACLQRMKPISPKWGLT